MNSSLALIFRHFGTCFSITVSLRASKCITSSRLIQEVQRVSGMHSRDGHSAGGCSGTSSISSVMGTPRTEAILSRVLKDTSCWGFMNAFSSGTARHAFINARMENIDRCRVELIKLVGEEEALRLIVQETDQKSNEGK